MPDVALLSEKRLQVRNLEFSLDHAFSEDATQKEVYDIVCRQAASQVLQGLSVCVLAYGQTGSGKTHTMLGSDGVMSGTGSPEHMGICLRAIADLFAAARACQEAAEEAREAAEEVATAKALQVAVLEQALSAAVDDAEMERQSSVCGCWPRPAGIGARYGARLHGWAGVALGTALYRAGLRQDLPPSEFLPAALFEAEPVCTRAPPPSLAGGAPSAPFQLRAATRQTMGKGPS